MSENKEQNNGEQSKVVSGKNFDPNADITQVVLMGTNDEDNKNIDQQKLVGFFGEVLNGLASLSDALGSKRIIVDFTNEGASQKVKKLNPKANIALQMFNQNKMFPITNVVTYEEAKKMFEERAKQKQQKNEGDGQK